ncbi:unnamed protein product [Parnassius apollo]|uniref:(apollo) hypothetical protein n=1 Tax=Parnassius apollo TaxID=110799 RepID=A0A8S3XJF2_PARAO|nr:unnamed protein product [Parnassius apollo]
MNSSNNNLSARRTQVRARHQRHVNAVCRTIDKLAAVQSPGLDRRLLLIRHLRQRAASPAQPPPRACAVRNKGTHYNVSHHNIRPPLCWGIRCIRAARRNSSACVLKPRLSRRHNIDNGVRFDDMFISTRPREGVADVTAPPDNTSPYLGYLNR